MLSESWKVEVLCTILIISMVGISILCLCAFFLILFFILIKYISFIGKLASDGMPFAGVVDTDGMITAHTLTSTPKEWWFIADAREYDPRLSIERGPRRCLHERRAAERRRVKLAKLEPSKIRHTARKTTVPLVDDSDSSGCIDDKWNYLPDIADDRKMDIDTHLTADDSPPPLEPVPRNVTAMEVKMAGKSKMSPMPMYVETWAAEHKYWYAWKRGDPMPLRMLGDVVSDLSDSEKIKHLVSKWEQTSTKWDKKAAKREAKRKAERKAERETEKPDSSGSTVTLYDKNGKAYVVKTSGIVS